MIDFVIAGMVYLFVMFVVFFCVSFVTIGVTYGVAVFVRRCLNPAKQPDLALK